MQTDILLKRLQNFEFLRGLDHETLATLSKSVVWKVFANLDFYRLPFNKTAQSREVVSSFQDQ